MPFPKKIMASMPLLQQLSRRGSASVAWAHLGGPGRARTSMYVSYTLHARKANRSREDKSNTLDRRSFKKKKIHITVACQILTDTQPRTTLCRVAKITATLWAKFLQWKSQNAFVQKFNMTRKSGKRSRDRQRRKSGS